MKFSWNRFNIWFSIAILLNFCSDRENRLTAFYMKYGLDRYEFLFIVHISPHNCISCLYALEHLNGLQERIKANGENTLIAISGENSGAFWNLYNSLNLQITYLETADLEHLNLPNQSSTPYGYFYDLRRKHLLFHDNIPKEEVTFLALLNLIEKYSGILF